MFWNIFLSLCEEQNVKPNRVAKDLGLSNAATTRWKNGSLPNATTMRLLSEYFNVSTDYLKGKTDIKEKAPDQNDQVQDKNVLRIAGRDGTYIERKLTDEQMRAFRLMVEQLPEADDL